MLESLEFTPDWFKSSVRFSDQSESVARPKKVDMENTPYLWFVRPVWSKVLLLAVFLPATCVFSVRDTCTERVWRLLLELVNLAEYDKG